MTETIEATGLIHRFVWSIQECNFGDDDFGGDADQICTDRLTDQVVVRYDLGDPANYAASHGGWSKDEYLSRKGFVPDEEIEISRAVIPVSEWEVENHAQRKTRKAERDREEAEAVDLLEAFPDLPIGAGTGYCSSDDGGKDWMDWENEVATPALEAAGYVSVSIYSIEADSFGPLIRGVLVFDADGNSRRFTYG
jgi:hypothetical protein